MHHQFVYAGDKAVGITSLLLAYLTEESWLTPPMLLFIRILAFSGLIASLAATPAAANAFDGYSTPQLPTLVGAGATQLTPQTVTFAAIASQSVGSTVTLVASASSGLPVDFTSLTPAVCTVTGATANLIAAGNCILHTVQLGNAVYAVAPTVTQTFKVSKLTQVVTFAALSEQVANSSASLTAAASSGLPVTLISGTPAVCTVTGVTASFIAGGNCFIRAQQPGNAIYAAAPSVTQIIDVEKLTQTVNFNAVGSQFTNSSVGLVASASSGLPVTLTTSTPSVCTLTGATANLIGGGTCTMHAVQAGNAVYVESPQVIQSFTVNLQTVAPVIFPRSGGYASPQTLILADGVPGALIYYTADGSAPSASSTLYTGPVLLNTSEQINAIAIANGSTSPLASAAYTVSLTNTEINLSAAIAAGNLTVNPSAQILGNTLQLTDGGGHENGSVWFNHMVPVNSFTTDFSFQLTNPAGKEFTFTFQNGGLNATGGASDDGSGDNGSGFDGISNAFALRFRIHQNDGGEGDSRDGNLNKTTLRISAAGNDLGKIHFQSGDLMQAHFVYDGSFGSLTLTDTATNEVLVQTFAMDIQGMLGSSTAYAGFTGSTGEEQTATQTILSWTYTSNNFTGPVAAAPVILPLSGYQGTPFIVTMQAATPNSLIYYTTDGSTPTSSSTPYTAPFSDAGPFSAQPNQILNAVAIAPGYGPSAITTASYSGPQPTAFSYPGGALTGSGLTLVNGATTTGGLLQLTDGGQYEARSAWYTTPVSIGAFTTDFSFQLLQPVADGFTFTIQNFGPAALGDDGGSLGYQGIGNSVALKFDLFNNAGEGSNSIGLYVNGTVPTVPATDLTSTGIDLHSGDAMHAHLEYDGNALALTLTDTATQAIYTQTFPVDIPGTVGGSTAFVGFTAATGSRTAIQNILSWSYTVPAPGIGSGGASVDVIVYGATPSGIMAAVEAAQLGKHVLLLEPTQHVGGMMTNGLGNSDEYSPQIIGGLPELFYEQISSYYGNSSATFYGWRFEPHEAEQVFGAMLAQQSTLTVRLSTSLSSLAMNGTAIAGLVASDGNTYQAKQYIDASYTGDLMAAAGVSYTVGRESSTQYNESFGGVGTAGKLRYVKVDPYVIPGDPSSGLLAHVSPGPIGAPGTADNAVMAYNYRVCLSSDPNNQLPFVQPPNYDPSEFDLLVRLSSSANAPKALSDYFGRAPLPNNKFDVNSGYAPSTDEVGLSFTFPNASAAGREKISAEQKRYMQALFYFIATDPRVPALAQQQMNSLGLCKDEFIDNGGWPHQIYVREARRMIGAYVVTQNDLFLNTVIPDPIGMGGYAIDDHINYIFNNNGLVYYEAHNGLLHNFYPIPYRILTPQASQVTNLLVPVEVSASHVAYDSLRVEITYMIMGQAAGAAASIAIDNNTTVQDVPYSALNTQLISDGVILSAP